ncbi:hypothetical protein ACFL2Q_20195, partial [Thermodesulfobacteriota bacterium]
RHRIWDSHFITRKLGLGLTDLIKPESVTKFLDTRVPAGFREVNLQALELGLRLGREHKS